MMSPPLRRSCTKQQTPDRERSITGILGLPGTANVALEVMASIPFIHGIRQAGMQGRRMGGEVPPSFVERIGAEVVQLHEFAELLSKVCVVCHP